MGLFNIIPSNFFSVLVSKNREIYVEALMILYQSFKFNLNITVSDYIAELSSVIEDKTFVPEDDDDVEDISNSTPTGKARLILNRFVNTGWVDKEFLDGSFKEIITPRDYAIKTMKFLHEIGTSEEQEYNSLVFATYSGLNQAMREDKERLYEAVLSARNNTERLGDELRTFYHGIRGHLREIQNQNSVNELLKNHFEEYKQMADRIYHPIKTMDSIHRYMAPIQNILSKLLDNSDLMHSICERAIVVKNYDTEQNAMREIVDDIDYVIDVYRSIGGIINEIDRKHRSYTKSSIEKIQYLMTADRTIKGKLVKIFQEYASGDDISRERVVNMLERNINVNRQEFIDKKSLYHKNARSRRVNTDPLLVEKSNDFSETEIKNMIAQLNEGYPMSRVRSYVNDILSDNGGEVNSKYIPIKNENDFILLILAVVRSSDRGSNYEIEMNTGYVEVNGYRIPNMTIRRRGNRNNVE